MNTDRRMRLWSLVVECARGAPVELRHICDAAKIASNVDSVGITVAVAATPRETLYVSDPVASVLEELALTFGEGPGVDALRSGVVLASDLTAATFSARWPVFAPAAARAGITAIFALPMQVGGIRLGVMNLYRSRRGGLERGQLTDALILADTACALLLDLAGPGPDRAHAGGPAPAAGQHPAVHQATGMLIAQLGVSATVAMTRLRAYAYTHDRRLRDVAEDVIARRLRFKPDG